MSGTVTLYHNDEIIFTQKFKWQVERKDIMDSKNRLLKIIGRENCYWQVIYDEYIPHKERQKDLNKTPVAPRDV